MDALRRRNQRLGRACTLPVPLGCAGIARSQPDTVIEFQVVAHRLRGLQNFRGKCAQWRNPQSVESFPVLLLSVIPLKDAEPYGESFAISGRCIQQSRFTGSDSRPRFLLETVGLPPLIEKPCFCEYVQ